MYLLILSLFVVGIIIAGFALFFVIDTIRHLKKDITSEVNDQKDTLKSELTSIKDRMDKSIADSSKTVESSQKTIKDITEEITKLKATNDQVVNYSKQLQSLENILKNPKRRGILGETMLETILSDAMQPNQYQRQYKFNNGDLVDFVVFNREKIIPIDAKFSLEKYNKLIEEKDDSRRLLLERAFKADLKDRIDETAKYIRPSENTTEFAFMFIPAEGVYYDLLIYKVGAVDISSQDLIEYAFKKHVIIASPTSFFAYLETVLLGLKAIKMEENIKSILMKISDLGRHLKSYEAYLSKVGNNLDATVSQYNLAYKEFNKIDKDIFKITEGEVEISASPILIEKTAKE